MNSIKALEPTGRHLPTGEQPHLRPRLNLVFGEGGARCSPFRVGLASYE